MADLDFESVASLGEGLEEEQGKASGHSLVMSWSHMIFPERSR
jgi:hypothetical protein